MELEGTAAAVTVAWMVGVRVVARGAGPEGAEREEADSEVEGLVTATAEEVTAAVMEGVEMEGAVWAEGKEGADSEAEGSAEARVEVATAAAGLGEAKAVETVEAEREAEAMAEETGEDLEAAGEEEETEVAVMAAATEGGSVVAEKVEAAREEGMAGEDLAEEDLDAEAPVAVDSEAATVAVVMAEGGSGVDSEEVETEVAERVVELAVEKAVEDSGEGGSEAETEAGLVVAEMEVGAREEGMAGEDLAEEDLDAEAPVAVDSEAGTVVEDSVVVTGEEEKEVANLVEDSAAAREVGMEEVGLVEEKEVAVTAGEVSAGEMEEEATEGVDSVAARGVVDSGAVD